MKSEKQAKTMPSGSGDAKASTRFDPKLTTEGQHGPWTWVSDSKRTMRAAPDIVDIARRGGLSPDITAYELGDKDGKLYVAASGNSTTTVNRCVTLGLGKAVEDARQLNAQFDNELSAEEIKAGIKNLNRVDAQWIQENIIGSDRSADELGAELFEGLIVPIPYISESIIATGPAVGPGQLPPSDAKAPERAVLIGELIRELHAMHDLVQSGKEDFVHLEEKFPDHLAFQIRRKHPVAQEFLDRLPYRRHVNNIAFHVAGAYFGKKSATMETDWKHHKPKNGKIAR